MKLGKTLFAVALAMGALGVADQHEGTVWAQSASTGAITGVIKDKATGTPLVGVTVVATSPALKGAQTAITLAPQPSSPWRARMIWPMSQ